MLNALSLAQPWAAAALHSAGAMRGPMGCLSGPLSTSHASTQMIGGKAVFENANYRISAGDNNEVVIENKNTGETYRAWGDPHMDIDGKHAFDFWGTTSFLLDDGTKVTIETTPWAGNANATVSSKVTITDGDYGVQITGVDTNTLGDLKIDEGQGWGRMVDWAVDDGNVLVENTFGKGFLAMDAQGQIRQVDQQYINETDLLKGGAMTQKFEDAFRVLGGLLSVSFMGVFMSMLGADQSDGRGASRRAPIDEIGPRLPMPFQSDIPTVYWALNRRA